MWLEKDNITIEVSHPTEIRHYKGIGFTEVKKAPKAEAEVGEPTSAPQAPEKTPEEQNAETIGVINASQGTPKTSLEMLTVAELKALAQDRGLEGYARLKKAELLALLGGGS